MKHNKHDGKYQSVVVVIVSMSAHSTTVLNYSLPELMAFSSVFMWLTVNKFYFSCLFAVGKGIIEKHSAWKWLKLLKTKKMLTKLY